ncbi:nitrate transporter [Peniophora sp. CONT]|nr:nitrate transporter [Peniophora sp. CONT]
MDPTAPSSSGRQSAWTFLTTVRVNPSNLKCQTLPLLSLRNQYGHNFHLSWLGFWVAFLSWFAFSPLVPEAVSKDLHLTPAQLGNSNVISLCATLLVRLIVGPAIDRYGPRKVMASLLVIGAIPSGLAGTVSDARGLYVIRFFIGILGGTFVPCQAWTTVFYDKNVVGLANALVGGWGNSGGGFTFIIMIALFNQLVADGLSSHSAWRAAFAIVPVPILLSTALLIMIFGTDHPAGKWSDRHEIPAARRPSPAERESSIRELAFKSSSEKVSTKVSVEPVSEVDTAINEPLTLRDTLALLVNPLTWLPALSYFTTFGFELVVDANLANVLYGLYKSSSFDQTKAGYIASIFGLLNIFTRPFGGYLSDVIYTRFGVKGKKYLMIALGISQGLFAVGLGVYIDQHHSPSLGVIIGLFVLTALFNEAGNGSCFGLVPHCNPNSNGLTSGIVGAFGNLGGVIFALIFRFQATPVGKAFWVCGIISVGLNTVLTLIRVPRW